MLDSIQLIRSQIQSYLTDPIPADYLYALEKPAPDATVALSGAEMAAYIDHTILKPDATSAAIARLCAEAIQHRFAAVCVNPDHIAECTQILRGSGVMIATVVGFPLGATTSRSKALETQECIQLGADEIDMVLNIGRLKDDDYGLVRHDVAAVVQAAQNHPVKVIIETPLLTDEEKIIACLLCQAAGAAFVKTCTGFNGGGATVSDVRLMRATIGPQMGLKAAGGIRDTVTAQALLQAGANRLGASASLSIIQEKS